jgi:Tfp pilus assembly protein PilN
MDYLNVSEGERTRAVNEEKKRKRKQQFLIYAIMGLLLIAAIAVIGVIMVNNKAIKKQNIANAKIIDALQAEADARKIAEVKTLEASASHAKSDSINFYKLETDVYTLLEVKDPAKEQLKQMDSIAAINPDSVRMKFRIEAIKNTEKYKKALTGNNK